MIAWHPDLLSRFLEAKNSPSVPIILEGCDSVNIRSQDRKFSYSIPSCSKILSFIVFLVLFITVKLS